MPVTSIILQTQRNMRHFQKIKWTEDMLSELKSHYTTETNEALAKRLGICSKTLVLKARSLGLVKKPVRTNKIAIEMVSRLYEDHSLSELARLSGISLRTVSRVVKALHLQRTPQMEQQIRSRRRKELIRRERAHVLYGLPQKTNIKVVSNKPRIALRSKLKARGYIVFAGSNTIYYREQQKRCLIRERNGRKLGLRFEPFNTDSGHGFTPTGA